MGFEVGEQVHNSGLELQRFQPKGKGIDLFVNDPLRLFRFDAPMGQVFFNHFFQIVDVIEVDVIHVVDVGIDVSGDRDVNEEHRPVFAAFQDVLDVACADNGFR